MPNLELASLTVSPSPLLSTTCSFFKSFKPLSPPYVKYPSEPGYHSTNGGTSWRGAFTNLRAPPLSSTLPASTEGCPVAVDPARRLSSFRCSLRVALLFKSTSERTVKTGGGLPFKHGEAFSWLVLYGLVLLFRPASPRSSYAVKCLVAADPALECLNV